MRSSALVFLACLAAGAPGSVDQLATAVAERVGAGGSTGVAVRGGAPRLVDTLAPLLAGRFAHGRVVESAAAARAAGLERFVEVELAPDAGDLAALGKVYDTERNFWDDAPPRVVASFAVRARVDAELRAYLGTPTAPATRPAPPRARRFAFRPLRAGLELGAPLLALEARDAEVIALTTDEVLRFAIKEDGAHLVDRVALTGAAPAPRPRAPVGTLAVIGRSVLARSSAHADGLQLADAPGSGDAPAAFPVCGSLAQLVPGQHLFAREGFEVADVPAAAVPSRFLIARCVGPVLAVLDPAGTLHLARAGDKAAWGAIPGIGTAFALADLDGDGALELVAAGFHAPGAPDTLTFYRLGPDGGAHVLRRGVPTPAGVAAMAVGDFDGDGGIDVLAAIRTADPGRFDLWLAD